MEVLRNSDNIVIGTKQTLRALEDNKAEKVYIALDADKKITSKVKDLALEKDVIVVEVNSMEELGKCCNVKVNTATCAIIKN